MKNDREFRVCILTSSDMMSKGLHGRHECSCHLGQGISCMTQRCVILVVIIIKAWQTRDTTKVILVVVVVFVANNEVLYQRFPYSVIVGESSTKETSLSSLWVTV